LSDTKSPVTKSRLERNSKAAHKQQGDGTGGIYYVVVLGKDLIAFAHDKVCCGGHHEGVSGISEVNEFKAWRLDVQVKVKRKVQKRGSGVKICQDFQIQGFQAQLRAKTYFNSYLSGDSTTRFSAAYPLWPQKPTTTYYLDRMWPTWYY